ncbi:phosphotransferase family protein [Microbacterium sp. No. 7]|uniref:phosphotransferase family protein n=1 Tax=Microbacterium sp. No. 7 TaxID=1714373 RepID=UPI0006ED0F79|nr:phosphotransferase family protein [Microbacterium sp. No. 7]ALJ18821.1 hypothetical protein AOA12_02385 [Microbacterium sp. No. 7]
MSGSKRESEMIVAPAQRDLGELARQLTAWLQARLGVREVRVRDLSYPRGAGQSHETILFSAAWDDADGAHDRGLVVRIKPTAFTVFYDDLFEEQFRLMRVLHESGRVRVAPTLWLEDDPEILGAPFFVMERLSGRVAVSHPPYTDVGWVAEASPAERERLFRNSIRELAAISSIPLDSVGFLAGPGGVTGMEQEWDRWTRFLDRIDRHGRPAPVHRRVWERLRDTMPGNRPAGLVWGDARLGNVMVDDDFEVVALMDWEQPSLGGALHDLGWWLVNQRTKIFQRGGRPFEGMPDAETTAALWREHTGIPTDGLEWYEAFAGFKTACLAVNMIDLRAGAVDERGVAQTDQLRVVRELTGV